MKLPETALRAGPPALPDPLETLIAAPEWRAIDFLSDLHLAPGAGQLFLQEAGDKALVVLDLLRDPGGAVLRDGKQRGGQHKAKREYETIDQIAHQNACPSPI